MTLQGYLKQARAPYRYNWRTRPYWSRLLILTELRKIWCQFRPYDLDKLGINELHDHWKRSNNFDGSFKTFKSLVRSGRIETEQDPLTTNTPCL